MGESKGESNVLWSWIYFLPWIRRHSNLLIEANRGSQRPSGNLDTGSTICSKGNSLLCFENLLVWH